MTNIVLANQGGKNFLFAVPKNVTLKKGDRVLCNTMRGEQDGICATDSFEVDERALKQIADLVGAYFPLKSVVGKVEVARFDKAITTVDLFFAGKQFIMGIASSCNDKNGEIKGECKILKNRSHADVKNGTIVDGVKYIKE